MSIPSEMIFECFVEVFAGPWCMGLVDGVFIFFPLVSVFLCFFWGSKRRVLLFVFCFNFFLVLSFFLSLYFFFLPFPVFFGVQISNFLYQLCFIYRLDSNMYGFKFDSAFSLFHFDDQFVLIIDCLGLVFVLLNNFLILICFLTNWHLRYSMREFFFLLFFCLMSLDWMFCCHNLFLFYVLFEVLLVPFYFFIGMWGSRDRKIIAAYQFFFFTFFGSLFILVGLVYIYYNVGIFDLDYGIFGLLGMNSDCFVWLCLFFGFSIKIPMFPVHLWLPEAHVEASTSGSILLAGLLLKLGVYALLRFLVPLFYVGFYVFGPFLMSLALIGLLYSSLCTLYQIDLKKLVAYSSIAHMNLALLGMFSYTLVGLSGSVLLLVSHGWVSSALFFLVGCLYDRYRSRLLIYYGGLAEVMPLYSVFLFFFSLANMGFPGTVNFLAELMIFMGFSGCFAIQCLLLICFMCGTFYSLWLINRLCFGPLKVAFMSTYCDLTLREFFVCFVMLFLVLFFGLFPKVLLWFCDVVAFGTLNFFF